ncbi:hypothetical protein E1176_09630 [Fulvivirga sp. RKSG066]|uniref:Cbp1 family collagen-binding glycoprotein adhesin n=1 Tax=Fulvivirga aurantia TaxID=2529383 RepID=UPI0012BC7CAD|nr:hypothetical protein [Fulvivirga aurantia]MTI21280.1 hypothetical protein [Fulvivirga aurantia]
MKKVTHYFTVLMLATLIVSCNQKEVDQLTAEKQELTVEKDSLNSNLEAYMQTFNEIERNLEEIKQREDKINLKTTDNVEFAEGDAKSAVVNDIQAINTLMQENRQKMEELQGELSSTNAEFKQMVNRLNSRLKEKDEQVIAMKEDLEQLNIEKEALTKDVEKLSYTVDTLENKSNLQAKVIETQNEKIDNQTEALNTGYVAIGTSRDLEEEKVIEKEGGVLGIGRTEKLSTNLNEQAFEKIDVTATTAIPVFAKKVELVTNHPKGSYELKKSADEKIQQLTILNPDEFWKSTKYLVVVVD